MRKTDEEPGRGVRTMPGASVIGGEGEGDEGRGWGKEGRSVGKPGNVGSGVSDEEKVEGAVFCGAELAI